MGALSNIGGRSGGRGLRNREEIGERTTETMESGKICRLGVMLEF